MRSELESHFSGVYIQSLFKGNRSMALCTPAVNAAGSLWDLHLKLRALISLSFILSSPHVVSTYFYPAGRAPCDYRAHYWLRAKAESIKRLPSAHCISYFSEGFHVIEPHQKTSMINVPTVSLRYAS